MDLVHGKIERSLKSRPIGFRVDALPPVTDCIEHIQTAERFAELAPHWRALEQRSAQGFIFFQSYDWCHHWWHTVGQHNPDAKIEIFTLWQHGELVAVWPLVSDLLPLSTKAMLPFTSPHAEYSNLIVDSEGVDAKRLGEFVSAVIAKCDVDLVSLPKIPTNSALHSATWDLGLVAPDNEVASIFDLSQFQDFEQYQASISKSTRRNRNKRKNKLAKLGHVTYRSFFAGTDEYARLVKAALHMKTGWLKQTGRNDAKLTMAGLSECLLSLPGDKAKKTGAVAGALMLDDKPVAVEVGFLQQAHYYSYIGAFDWEMREHSVGKIQIEEALRWAIETGVGKYDLLAEPAGYKDSWSNNAIPLETRVIARSWRGKLVGVLWQLHVRPKVKSYFNRLPSNWRLKILHIVRALRGQTSN